MRWRGALSSGSLPWLLGLAVAGFVACLMLPQPLRPSALCGSIERMTAGNLDLMLGPQWSPAATVAAWLVMLLAMMPPLLARPVGHLWGSSMAGRRAGALLLFGVAYMAVWLSLSALLVPAAVILRLGTADAAPVVAVGLALAWSASPLAQAARNRCHRLPAITAFGRAADLDSLKLGMTAGLACAGTCWPWMVLPMTFDGAHVAAMATVSVLLFVERLAPPSPAVWQPPAFLTVLWALKPPQKVLGNP